MSQKTQNPFARIPAVDKVLLALEKLDDLPPLPQPLITNLVRDEIKAMREGVKEGHANVGEFEETVADIRGKLESFHRSRIRPVINGTGICIHTNLGRSPLHPEVVSSLSSIGQHYNNIELDLDSGERGKRGGFLESCLATLCEAESATVTNNCAAALILMLKHLANGERNEVIISRGELVEIGGGFRVPEIMEASGARLVEVGATNKTSLEDYQNAISPRTGMLLKVHRSNFWMDGFTDEPTTEELVELGNRHDLPVVEDLGSGAMVMTDEVAPIPHEPTALEVLNRGVDLVCVSGDKLFGGPQAGIIAGRADLVAGIKKEPFFRALRCDKLILTGMQETVLQYLHQHGTDQPQLPLIRMLSASVDKDLRPRAEAILDSISAIEELESGLVNTIARCGGGTMPKAEIPSLALDLMPKSMGLPQMARLLREQNLPVVGYVAEDRFRIDLRTVFPEQDQIVVENLLAIFGNL
ncbi:MAG: L-seryl-tRNA(Sec) selenium transferase [Verrucomicrobiales bacterium]|nr:L-seryl-tRNA(Sec) selenium transferase [Verrucomicrobiales bacterium]|tara:strand:- start:18796 stop:20208 length:1413 start_codon:yes stop_codon:yes gene_type:complete